MSENKLLEDKKTSDVKKCPFNPFGEESCDMCGSW